MSLPIDADPEAVYQRRCAEFGAQRDRYQRRSSRNANLSLALVVAALLCFSVALWRESNELLILAALLGAGFVVSFIHHGRVDQTLRRYAELFGINDEGLARLARDWDALPLRQPVDVNRKGREARKAQGRSGQIFAPLVRSVVQEAVPNQRAPAPPAGIIDDLDLLGHASLQHLLNTPATPVGLATLHDWLLAPATPVVARARQAAVVELVPLIELRDQFALRGRLAGAAQSRAHERSYEQFLAWAEQPPWLPGRGWLLFAARLLPLATLLLALAQLAGLTSLPLWLGGIAVGLVLSQTIGRAVDREIDEVAERQTAFAAYAELFGLLGAEAFQAPELRRLQAELSAAGPSAEEQMRRLSRLLALADLRGWMFFYPIQLATLWNVHVLWLLDRWRGANGARARGWLAALGAFEALAALAALSHDNPAWVFPELADPRSGTKGHEGVLKGDRTNLDRATHHFPDAASDMAEPILEARGLGHPLLPPAACVGNDVALGPAGRLLLITGSNMSGKSTLLRAIGLNIVLAQAGGPVCAAAMCVAPVALATSMRVQDSLEQGVSYFMAELQRLKQVVDAAAAQARGERTLLFLLDEILHGTNTSERQIAARRIMLHLLNLGAAGAVSTHDLALAEAPELAAVSDVVHFTEQFTRGPEGLTMRFDYRLRPGVATSTNALKLMEMIGLPASDELVRLDAHDGGVEPQRHDDTKA